MQLVRWSGGATGQASGEYLGVLLLVAVIIAAVIFAAPGLGIDTRLRELICKIGGGSCEEQVADNEPCTISTSGRDASLNLQIVAVDVEQGGSYLREDKSNKTTVFTVSDSGSIAAALRAGAKAKVGSVGFDATAEAAAGGSLEGARQYTVPTKDADALEDALSRQGGIGQLLRDGVEGGITGPAIDLLNDEIFGEDEPDLPEPTSEIIDAKGFVSASASASAEAGPLGGAALEAALEGAGGARRILSGKDEGKTELYIQLDSSAAGSLSLATLGPGASTESSAIAVLTLDGTTPTELKVTASSEYSGSINLGQELTGADLGDVAKVLEDASISGSAGSGRNLEFGASLPLDGAENSENLAAATQLLTQGAAGVPGLVRRFDEQGTLTLQTADVSNSDTEVSANVGLGVNAGGGGSQSSSDSQTTSALIREPGAPGFSIRECG